MGQPRASRRKVVAISSDEEDDSGSEALPSDPSEDEQPVKPQSRSTGKLKPTKKSSKVQQSTPATSTQNGSSQKSPAKSKASRSRGKAAVKDQPASNGRTIHSFFNAATQRQQSSQPSASPGKLSTPLEEPEIIQDDSGDEKGSGVHLTKGSSTYLAMRKRKLQSGESFDSDVGLPPPASQKFRKTSSGDRTPSFPIINDDKRPWTEQFAPKDLSELAVHKRKVADVRQLLEMTMKGRRKKVLVLKGAAGTGKTTTVRLLAQELGCQVMEWKNPGGADMTPEGSASAAPQFDDFVSRAGRSGGLELTAGGNDEMQTKSIDEGDDSMRSDERRQILLIEEFPNTFSRISSTLQAFRSTILQYLASPTLADGIQPTPIVMVISETLLSTSTALADSFTAHRLLGPELANHPYLNMIEFNAVAPTYLTKALKAIVLKEARKSGRRTTPGPQVLNHLAETGDIRSAVSSLEFLCLRGDDGDTWSSKVTFSKPKKAITDTPLTQSEQEALKLISNRETTLGIFHAVGKVVYNKRIDSLSVAHPPPWLPQHRRDKVPENDVNDLIDELGTDTSTFTAALHENYALSCASTSKEDALDSLLGSINGISDADLLSIDRFSFGTRAFSGSAIDSFRQDEMAFQVGVRELLFSLPYPVHRSTPADGKKADAHRMFYPTSLKLWRKREDIEGALDLLTAKFQAGSLTDQTRSRKPASSAVGVESWKRDSSLDGPIVEPSSRDSKGTQTCSAKTEMTIERLPYISQIMAAKSTSSSVLEQILRVTRIRGSAPIDEEEDAEIAEDAEIGLEQWTTDQPDAESGVKTSRNKPRNKQRLVATEGGGLTASVESRVEKLILEDDDIVDD